MARKKFQQVALRANLSKVTTRQAADMRRWLEKRGMRVTMMVDGADGLTRDIDLLVVLGGDGTLLWCARSAAPLGVPIIGVDYGELGFLSEIKASHAKPHLEKVFDGRFQIRERMLIEYYLLRKGEKICDLVAVNDIVVSKCSARLLRLGVSINDEYFHEFPGDGLILSSSTGSTAYSLSAGGPIVSPNLDVIILTPICPHTLFARSIITSASDWITVKVPETRTDVILTVDGQIEQPLCAGDEVIVRRAPFRAKFVRVRERDFYGKVREKFKLT